MAQERSRPPSVPQKLTAEFIGTFALTLVAAGADIFDALPNQAIGHVARYLAPGLLIVALIWALSGISGAHVNPVVTLAFVARRVFPIRLAVFYWMVQLLGAICAALVLRAFFKESIAFGVTKPGASFTAFEACVWEALLTFFLVFVILATAEQEAIVGKNAALAVGFTVALCGLFSSPLSGASMNPARSLGPQIVAGELQFAWIYLAGPALGALAATVAVRYLVGPPRHGSRKAATGNG
ncbi:MAG: MIP/aquaporin family protein [Vulcanimicrobiaceae bacterium]